MPMIQKNVMKQKSLEKSQKIGVNFFRIFWANFKFFCLHSALHVPRATIKLRDEMCAIKKPSK